MPTETYQPGPEGQDTTVFSALPASTNGTLDYIEVGRINNEEARAFLKFPAIAKPGYTVSTATLEIYVFSRNDPPDVDIENVQVHRIGASWDEARVTWNDQPAVTGAMLSQANVTSTGTWVFSVAAAVQEWQVGGTNNGFRLAFPPGGDSRSFRARSSDYQGNALQRPRLVVTYVVDAPLAPIIDLVAFPANETQVLSWTFKHGDPNVQQTAYEVEIYRASDAEVFVDTGKVVSGSTQYTLPAATLDQDTEYQWRVRTWGPDDVVGPWSGYDLFITEARPTATITSPTVAQVVETSSYLVDWTYSGSSAQASYRVRLYNNGTNDLVHDSGVVTSVLTQYTVPDLQDNTTYRAEVTVTSENGVSNNPAASVTFSVDTVPPPAPQVVMLGQTEYGRVRLTITNPAAGAGQVATASNTVYRRLVGDTVWTDVGTVALNSTFDDYTVAGGTSYEYKVVAVSVADTEASTTTTGTVDLYGVWIHEPSDPATTLGHFFYDGLNRDETYAPEVELMRFAGRAGAVAEFGPQDAVDQVECSVQLASGDTDRDRLRALARRRVVICYRDGQQRKVYGVITNLTIRDEKYGGSATFRVERVDYTEGS